MPRAARWASQRVVTSCCATPMPTRLIISACVLLPASLVGAVAGLFAWSFVAIPGLMFDLDPGIALTVLPAALVVFGLIGAAYALLELWA